MYILRWRFPLTFLKYQIIVIYYVRSFLGPFQMFPSCLYSNVYLGCFSEKEWLEMLVWSCVPVWGFKSFAATEPSAQRLECCNFLRIFYSKPVRSSSCAYVCFSLPRTQNVEGNLCLKTHRPNAKMSEVFDQCGILRKASFQYITQTWRHFSTHSYQFLFVREINTRKYFPGKPAEKKKRASAWYLDFESWKFYLWFICFKIFFVNDRTSRTFAWTN